MTTMLRNVGHPDYAIIVMNRNSAVRLGRSFVLDYLWLCRADVHERGFLHAIKENKDPTG